LLTGLVGRPVQPVEITAEDEEDEKVEFRSIGTILRRHSGRAQSASKTRVNALLLCGPE
jgi:hypothetical protein